MSDTDIHQFQDESFPKMKAPMEKEDHPDHHVPESTREELGPYLENLGRLTASNRAVQPGKAK